MNSEPEQEAGLPGEPAVEPKGREPEEAGEQRTPELVRPPRRNMMKTGADRGTRQDEAPSGQQLGTTRAAHWHQDGNALLSQDALKEWVARAGLVLFAPRAQQLGVPAPSIVEATLGRPVEAPGPGDMDAARTLLARLVADGAVVPLHLLGLTGGMGTDTPDYVCSAAVFSFIFTLHGNKSWKTPPATSGAVKVSPLALAAYEILSSKVMLSAYDLTTQLGKEVTEAAVLRALTELWSQLRVIPVPQADGSATLWELASTRFTKQIKSGANAGQPTALSALISLYLGQALLAEESEIETFLSPLAARSRVREVVHALVSARQLESIVIEGKTLLHVAGETPAFAPRAEVALSESVGADGVEGEGGSRVRKFAGKPERKLGTGLRSKPSGAKPFGSKPPYKRAATGEDRERRPFQRDRGGAPAAGSRPPFRKPAFDKPWDEARGERGARPPRRDFAPRVDAAAGDGEARPPRPFTKPKSFGGKREGFAGKPSFGRSEGRPPRRDNGDRPGGSGGGFKRPFSPRPAAEDGERRDFRPRPPFGERTGAKFASKPRFDRERPAAAGGDEGAAPRKVYRKFDAPRGDRKPFGARPSRPAGGAGERPPRSFDRAGEGGARPPRRDGPGRETPRREGRPSFGRRPAGPAGERAGGRPPFKRASGPAAGGPFAKFSDGNKKPFRKQGSGARGGSFAAKKSAGPRREGGFAPTRRKRDEESE